MKHVQPFSLTIEPVLGECETSLAARLAFRNGIPRLVTFCSFLGLDYLSLANGEPDTVRYIARLAGQDPEPLLSQTPSLIEDDWFRLGHQKIKFSAFVRSKPRVCPVCAQSRTGSRDPKVSVFHKGLWQLGSIRSCHEHGCLLQPLPKPETPKDHFDAASLGRGHVFDKPIPVPEDQMAFERYLVDRIDGQTSGTWLDQLPFHVASQTCETFGLLLTQGPKAKRALASPQEWLEAGLAGYKVLKDGPEAFIGKLAEIAAGYPPAHAKYRAQFGVFFEWLRYMDDDPNFDVIRDIVREFVIDNYPVATRSLVLGKEAPMQMLYNIEALVKEAPTKRAFLTNSLYVHGYMKVASRPGRYLPTKYVKYGDKIKILDEAYKLRNLKQAAKNIGVSEAVIKDLTKHGFLKRHFTHKGAVPAYHTNELWGFYLRLTDVWKPAHHKGLQTNRVSIREAAQRCKCSMWQVLALIIEHKILITKPDRKARGVDALMVNPKHINKVLDRAQENVTSCKQAAIALETNSEGIQTLIKRGLLRPQKKSERRPNQKHRAVYTDSLEAIIGKYGSAQNALSDIESSVAG